MPDPSPRYFLTTPIYYVNGHPHIGTAYTTLVADVLARRHRLLGDQTFFLTGTDEHGQKIERSAAAAGVPPQQFVDEVAAEFKTLWDRMGLTYTKFIRTTSEDHKRGVDKLFRKLQANDQIYLDSYTGQYCVADEAFVDVAPGAPCPDCGRITETVTEENYFFRLSQWGERVNELIESGALVIEPEARRNEVLSFVRGGLKDLSISRSSFTWGIPVPDDPKHVIYVWLDALVNYMTAIGYGSELPADKARFEKFWPADLHLVGKEIIRFHCVYWPAFLMAAGLPTPKKVVAHGWLLFEESKMSKSKGNIVRAETILDAFGPLCPAGRISSGLQPAGSTIEQTETLAPAQPTQHDRDLFATDVLRYFLLREIPFGQDGSFSFEALVTRYNADLANGYGNLVSRTLNMVWKYFEGRVPDASSDDVPLIVDRANYYIWLLSGTEEDEFRDFEELADSMKLESLDFTEVLRNAAKLVSLTDSFLSEQAPWKARPGESENALVNRRKGLLYGVLEDIRIITALLYPVMPYATASVWRQLGLGEIEDAAARGELKDLQWGGLKPGTTLGTLAPIFPRADKGLVATMNQFEQDRNTPMGHANAAHDAETPSNSEFPELAIASAASASTHPAAPPRTSSLEEPNAGAQVAASAAATTGADASIGHAEGYSEQAAAPGGESPQIAIDDFVKIELRAAKIVVAERIPKADKLLRLEVDLGYQKRQILSGIAEWYTPEELIGRRIVVITNLAPRKMRGLESHGMLLAASHGDNGKPFLATFGESDDVPLGSRLK